MLMSPPPMNRSWSRDGNLPRAGITRDLETISRLALLRRKPTSYNISATARRIFRVFFASSRRAASSRHRYRLYTVRPSVCLAPAAKSSLIDRQNSDNTGTKLVVATLNKILARNFGSSFTIFVGR